MAKLGRPVKYERDLLDQLLHDLARGGVKLPHLQIICTELYRALAEGEMQITLASYEELGGAEGILTGYLNSVLKRQPTRRQALAKEILKELSPEYGFSKAYIFGSIVEEWGRFRRESDVDIAVFGLKNQHFFRMMAEISRRLERNVDLCQIEAMDEGLRKMVEERGVLWARED